MSTQDLDIVSIGVSAGSALIQDLKATITTWTKNATSVGHFNAANAAVVVGCVVTFSDASTATIVAKTGDGTAASSVTLSADHATDAALASITGLVYVAPNVQPNAGYFSEITGGLSSAGSTNIGSGYTCIFTGIAIPVGRRITKCGIYSTNTSGNITFKLAQDNGSGTYTLTNLQTFTKSSAGYQEFSLTTPYVVPSSGTFYLGIYVSVTQINALVDTAGTTEYAKAGDLTGSQSSWTTNNLYTGHITVCYDQFFGAADLYAVATDSAQINTNSWFALSGVAVTQSLGTGAVAYHAACCNKGNSAETWWVYLSSTWRSIVALTSGTWQYRDAGGTLQNATINSRLGALQQAFAIAQNQMSKTALEAITADQWAAVFVSGTLDFACGMQASGINLPQLDKWTATYTPKPVYAIGNAGWVAGLSSFGG